MGIKSEAGTLHDQNRQLEGEFVKTMGSLKEALDAQTVEMKAQGTTSEKTVKRLEELEGHLAKIGELNAELVKQHDDLVKRAQRPGYGKGARTPIEMTVGEAFVKSAAYEAMRAAGALQSERVPIGSPGGGLAEGWKAAGGEAGFWAKSARGRRMALEVKGLSSSVLAEGGVLIQPLRLPDVQRPIATPRHLRDILPVTPISTDTVEYFRETGFNQVKTMLAEAASSGDTTITVANAGGIINSLDYAMGSITVGGETVAVGATAVARNADGSGVVTLASALTGGHAAGAVVTYNHLGVTLEGELKPNAGIGFDEASEKVKTLAVGIPASRQVLEDAPRLRSYIDNRLLESLLDAEDRHFLSTDRGPGGVGGHALRGLAFATGGVSHTWSNGEAGDTLVDAIRRAIGKVRVAGYAPDYLIMHPNRAQDLDLLKASDGRYLRLAEGGRVWGVQIFESPWIDEGTALVGNFTQACELFDREKSNVRVADQHSDFFMRNMLQILAEERLMLAIYRPESFCTINFDAAP